MNALVMVALVCMGLVGMRWRIVAVPVLFIGMLLIVSTVGIVASLVWMGAYTLVLFGVARRGRMGPTDAADGHLRSEFSPPVSPYTEAYRVRNMVESFGK